MTAEHAAQAADQSGIKLPSGLGPTIYFFQPYVPPQTAVVPIHACPTDFPVHTSAQTPAIQYEPPEQTMPQPPQLALSVFMRTQELPQVVLPAGQLQLLQGYCLTQRARPTLNVLA